ncbi:hypothetical protein B0H13DRAFT_2380288 [Mycena leptocephala]|nr:hypothetical protein B0H13DRAFT_2380288 [Mycena leptocephala]
MSDHDTISAGVYYFVRDGEGDVLEHAVDPEAMTYSHVSQTTHTRENFRTLVAERDVACVFTNMNVDFCQGIHIVPFSKGGAWMKQIVESRIPEEDEDASDLRTIYQIQNGMLVSTILHPLIDNKKLVVMKTPNCILTCNDIPHVVITPSSMKTSNTRQIHYTLQWLMATEHHKRDVPNNKDAAFKKHSKKPKPSPLLLHYNYGVAALKWWGKGPEYLLSARTRPAPLIAAPLGPSRSTHDRSLTTTKLAQARQLAGLQGGSGDNGEVDDIDARHESEAERLVLTFYANTPAARSRRAKQQAERTDRMIQWQNGVRMGLEAVLGR